MIGWNSRRPVLNLKNERLLLADRVSHTAAENAVAYAPLNVKVGSCTMKLSSVLMIGDNNDSDAVDDYSDR